MLRSWLGPLISAVGRAGGWERDREKIWISFSFGCGRRDVGKGSPPPSPSHNLRNSGESEVANPDFQGYLKAVWTWSLYYFCQSSALDNSIASTLILKFEDFRIKKKRTA